jgi:hypothetical protein
VDGYIIQARKRRKTEPFDLAGAGKLRIVETGRWLASKHPELTRAKAHELATTFWEGVQKAIEARIPITINDVLHGTPAETKPRKFLRNGAVAETKTQKYYRLWTPKGRPARGTGNPVRKAKPAKPKEDAVEKILEEAKKEAIAQVRVSRKAAEKA